MSNEETKVEFKVCSIDYISLKNILNFPEIKESDYDELTLAKSKN